MKPSAIPHLCYTCIALEGLIGCPSCSARWIPKAVELELKQGHELGFGVPETGTYPGIHTADPKSTPSEWLALDLGTGELAAIALAFENRTRVILLDDALARRLAKAAGLNVQGTLKVLLDAKDRGLTERVGPLLDGLQQAGMWLSADVRRRILKLAGEI